jgi:hypothetical protein
LGPVQLFEKTLFAAEEEFLDFYLDDVPFSMPASYLRTEYAEASVPHVLPKLDTRLLGE